MKIGFSGQPCEETGESVLQVPLVGDCLKVGILCEEIDPAEPAPVKYHHLPHPETRWAYDSVCTRPAAQQSPPLGGIMQTLIERGWGLDVHQGMSRERQVHSAGVNPTKGKVRTL
ncbi:MAG: hypothetical protein DMG30_06155 [Acidobacteria bacterium]|nr:MAG: hypothetical protein DMG30_06155 [Acidobacteriota bacterium]